MRSTKILRPLALVLFAAGAILGLILGAGIIWGDLEASLFDATMSGEERLSTLRCPALMTTRETGRVSATVTNALGRDTEFMVRTHISDGYVTLMQEYTAKLPLASGERGRLEWEVFPENAVYGGRLILVRVYQFAKYPLPARHGTCGILIIHAAHWTGTQILALTLSLSLLAMLVGAGLWLQANRPLHGIGAEILSVMGALAGFVLAGIIVGLAGWWVPGVIILTITVLLIGAILGYFGNKLERLR